MTLRFCNRIFQEKSSEKPKEKFDSVTDLDYTIRQINISSLINTYVLSDIEENEKSEKLNYSKKEEINVEKSSRALSLLCAPLRFFFLAFHCVATAILFLLALPLPFYNQPITQLSVFAQQLLFRLHDFVSWSSLYRKTKLKGKYDESSSEAFMKFWGSSIYTSLELYFLFTVFRSLIDMLFGSIGCFVLFMFSSEILEGLHSVFFIPFLFFSIVWAIIAY